MSVELPLTHYIPLGTTEFQDFELRDNGVALDGTGLTVTLEIAKRVDGVMTAVASPPTVAWLNQALGTVRITGAGTLTAGTYYVRYKLTDAGLRFGYVPNGAKADRWMVVAIPSV